MDNPLTQPESPYELNRKIENIVRLGKPARCRVRTGGLLSNWVPFFSLRAGGQAGRTWWPPVVDEQCVLLCPGGELLIQCRTAITLQVGNRCLRITADDIVATADLHTSGMLVGKDGNVTRQKDTARCPLSWPRRMPGVWRVWLPSGRPERHAHRPPRASAKKACR